jgi:hypothetical protein
MPISAASNGKLQPAFLARVMHNDRSHLCRGDTISPHLSLSNLYFKLDFRIIVKDFNTDDLDAVTGEFARQSSTASSKVHLNAALKRMPFMPPTKIKTVVAPMIQIMGLSCVVYGMNIIDKKVYTLQRLCSFNYPSTQREVKSGAIKSFLDGFALVEVSETSWNRFDKLI